MQLERTEFQHILIDEYQDLNRAEQDALRLMGDGGATCVIGDDDQSIYSFKHAHPEGIQQWPTLQPTDSHEIAECQRCPTTVVAMATALIAKNTGRAAKQPLQPIAAKGLGDVVIRQYSTVDLEADAVADKIVRLIGSGVSPGEIIVLTQRATFAKPILERLLAKSIPTRSYYSETELDSAAAQERFAIFKLLLNNNDRVALRWLLGTGTSDWRRKPYRRIMHHVSQNGSSPWAVLSQIADRTLSLPHTRPLVERFRVIRAEIQSLAGIADLDSFIQAWLPSTPDTALLEVAVNVAKEGATTPQDLFDELYETITQPEVPNEVAEVRIMSLHKSKGLSSPYVFIVGCTEGLLPGKPDSREPLAVQQAKLEEDRRLFYVGITRVKATPPERPGYLALTYAQRMPSADAFGSQIAPVRAFGNTAFLQASRFIGEMAPHAPAPLTDSPL